MNFRNIQSDYFSPDTSCSKNIEDECYGMYTPGTCLLAVGNIVFRFLVLCK